MSAQSLELVVALTFPKISQRDDLDVEIWLPAGDRLPSAPFQLLRFTYDTHAENDRQPRNRAVERRVAILYAERARGKAVEHARAGEYDRARHVLTSTERRIRGYAGGERTLYA